MESPKPAVKKQYGCTEILVRLAIGVAIILAIDYAVTFTFHWIYPPNEITKDLIPLQNGYLARTDAFVTSEGMASQFNDDPGATTRFLSLCIIPVVGIFLLSVVLYLIPFTRKLLDYMGHAILFCFAVLMFDSLFIPPTMTVFDRMRNVMVIHRPEWIFFGTETEIPFEKISGFSYEIVGDPGLDVRDDIGYAHVYAETTDGKIFIGEDQMSMYAQDSEAIPVPREKRLGVEAAVRALHKLIGK
jgi:hypothetical protein